MCGVVKQFLALGSGLSGRAGSTDKTSSPAPAILPEVKASAKSFSLIIQDMRKNHLRHQSPAVSRNIGNHNSGISGDFQRK
jgi:hypothetical protein